MEDIEKLRAAQAVADGSNEEVFEDEAAPKPAKTTHHIRANSTIMHLNKILGELYRIIPKLASRSEYR
jgi:pyruvate carboxylase